MSSTCPAVNLINIFLYGVKLILYLCSFCDVIVVNNSDDDKSNLPFTEVMITDVCRLAIKINQSKRAWCKSHALNIFI